MPTVAEVVEVTVDMLGLFVQTGRRWMKMKMVAIVATFMLVGCAASARVVILQHPDTKQTVDCRVDGTVSRPYLKQENCITAYESIGYRVVSDSDKR